MKRIDTVEALRAWLLVEASILLAAVTYLLFTMYGTVHWPLASSAARLADQVREDQLHQVMANPDLRTHPTAEMATRKKAAEDFYLGVSRLFRITGAYRFTGWASFVLGLAAFTGRPRWAGLVSLPFAIFGLATAQTIM